MSSKSKLLKAAADNGGAVNDPDKPIPPAHRVAYEDPDRLLTQREFLIVTGWSESSYYEERAKPNNDLPRPIKLGRVNRYVLREAKEYVARRVAERDADMTKEAA